jgi:hypothetical protein
MFHRLAVFLGAFGADFCSLLALFVDYLLATASSSMNAFSAPSPFRQAVRTIRR